MRATFAPAGEPGWRRVAQERTAMA